MAHEIHTFSYDIASDSLLRMHTDTVAIRVAKGTTIVDTNRDHKITGVYVYAIVDYLDETSANPLPVNLIYESGHTQKIFLYPRIHSAASKCVEYTLSCGIGIPIGNNSNNHVSRIAMIPGNVRNGWGRVEYNAHW